MDAPRSAGAPVSSPAAAQRCAEGAGLDSGVLAAAQSAMLSIAAAAAMIADMISTRAAAFDDPSATARIYTRLTDVTDNRLIAAQLEKSWEAALCRVETCEARLEAVRTPE